MPPTITTQNHALISNAEVSFGTIAGGPFDFIDTYASVGVLGVAEWRLYGTVAGVQSLLASAPGGGLNPALLRWDVGGNGSLAPSSPAKATATTYELRAFWPEDQGPAPNNVTADLVGYNEFDVAADGVAGGGVVVVPTSGAEVVVGTVANGGWSRTADVSVLQSFAQPVRFTLYAQAGALFVAVVSMVATRDLEVPADRIFGPVALPGAIRYQLRASLAIDLLGQAAPLAQNVTATLATHSPPVAGGGVILVGNTNGPSNANTEQTFVTSTVNANVNVAAQAHPSGDIYVGLNGLTAPRTVFLNTTATGAIGDKTIVKDEDGSLAAWNIIVDSGAGNTIDGAQTYTMTVAQNGIKGSATFLRISATAWAIV